MTSSLATKEKGREKMKTEKIASEEKIEMKTLNHAEINKRKADLYHLITPLGDIYVVKAERKDLSLCEKAFVGDLDKATKAFSFYVGKLVKGLEIK